MDAEKTTSQKITEILDAGVTIESVKTPPFFKDKVLQRLSRDSETRSTGALLPWFVPKYQWATLLIMVLLNLVALYYYNKESQVDELQTLVEYYQLSPTDGNSILN
ncbi:hypothetical protein M3P19_13945 [Muricauda sp. 2012CJ35-5]|uniref:Uncharacterized protein n=1 Tax=Flagellimonas spongiicola TaxID=2942208 RepID=A0ABT0PUQ4_9FLAO|nr:hypothetical protein [Allomuricauda spongiicola]MCL6275117.1 hypothetical protein [Allomuricauda spongiicola]